MNSGFTLHYDGVKFGPNSTFFSLTESIKEAKKPLLLTATEKLGYCFSQIGALAIRMHNGQSQRADLIQGALDPDYLKHPVESTAKGGDQEDVFPSKWKDMPACPALASRLEKNALATLGKGKLLNERGQRVLHLNKLDYRGEENLWEKIHASVWHTGISFARELSEQGFVYICCPPDASAHEYNRINNALSSGNFHIEGSEVFADGYRLQTNSLAKFYCNATSIIKLDPELAQTFQPNGLVIDLPECGGKAPLGWMLHKGNQKIVPQELVEDSIRIIRLAKGGYHELSPEEQPLLAVGPKNGLGGVTQSPVFNALYVISNHLEQEFGFNPEKLLGNSISISYNQVQEFFKKPQNVEDFLTGNLLTEMVQPLKVTKEFSARKREMPPRLMYPFKTLNNTTKAIAYAYDLQYKGIPLLSLKSLTNNPELPDVSIDGSLAWPSLCFGKQSAAILSTALLVTEQILLEQILSDAIENNNPKQLEQLLGSSHIVHQVMELSRSAPRDELGPILGLQFDYCDETVTVLRKALGFDVLMQLTAKLETPNILTDEALEEFLLENSEEKLEQALSNLYRLGKLLQNIPNTSARSSGSRGINAGLLPLMKKISPFLITKEMEGYFEVQVPGVSKSEISKTAAEKTYKSSKADSSDSLHKGFAVLTFGALFAAFIYLAIRKQPDAQNQ
ncbi:MAG: hypothetical protein K2Y01_05730 [Rhabdochlamydiaceae bacterium]|nr:hypothetical protein [Rhabdochlamydiaceae bacterium]